MKQLTRREMMKSTVLATGTLCTCQVLDAYAAESDCCNTPDLEPDSFLVTDRNIEIDLLQAHCLEHAGHAAFISIPEARIEMIVVHVDKGEFVALDRFCTHGRQVLSYNQQRQLLQCNNYNHSLFELDGSVYKGPAPTPLRSYPVTLEQDTLNIRIGGQA